MNTKVPLLYKIWWAVPNDQKLGDVIHVTVGWILEELTKMLIKGTKSQSSVFKWMNTKVSLQILMKFIISF